MGLRLHVVYEEAVKEESFQTSTIPFRVSTKTAHGIIVLSLKITTRFLEKKEKSYPPLSLGEVLCSVFLRHQKQHLITYQESS